MSGLARVRVTIISDTPLAAGALPLVNLVANVPFGAVYRTNHILKVAVEAINGSAPTATTPDTALHVVGYFGDANGDGRYTTADVQAIQRIAAGVDKMFPAWAGISPLVIADIDGSGKVTASDGSRLLQEISGTDRPEIPLIPVAPASSASVTSALRSVTATPTMSPVGVAVSPVVAELASTTGSVKPASSQAAANSVARAVVLAKAPTGSSAAGTVVAPIRVEPPAAATRSAAATGGASAPAAEAAVWLETLLTTAGAAPRLADPNDALRITLPPTSKKETEKTVRTHWAVAAE
jgi:hypothetical protein